MIIFVALLGLHLPFYLNILLLSVHIPELASSALPFVLRQFIWDVLSVGVISGGGHPDRCTSEFLCGGDGAKRDLLKLLIVCRILFYAMISSTCSDMNPYIVVFIWMTWLLAELLFFIVALWHKYTFYAFGRLLLYGTAFIVPTIVYEEPSPLWISQSFTKDFA